jgi:hypothetical protein
MFKPQARQHDPEVLSTSREREFLAAYDPGLRQDHMVRAEAFSEGVEKVHREYPDEARQ